MKFEQKNNKELKEKLIQKNKSKNKIKKKQRTRKGKLKT